ncbi:MAG: hypothetical protein IJ349_10800 [Clostridia bacterium]|nr:hypothetical protein [Clostridia bacterium]
MSHGTNQNETFQLFHKPSKSKMKVLTLVFIWIAIWNVIYQYLHSAHLLHFEIGSLSLGVENWAFFAAVTLFFMQEELSYKDRFWHTLCGGTVGLLLAGGVVATVGALMKQGLDHATAASIPLVIVVAALILLHPCIPLFFNNVGFIYLIVAFVKSDVMLENLPSYILSLALGSIILNLGCSFVINQYTKLLQKKTAKK